MTLRGQISPNPLRTYCAHSKVKIASEHHMRFDYLAVARAHVRCVRVSAKRFWLEFEVVRRHGTKLAAAMKYPPIIVVLVLGAVLEANALLLPRASRYAQVSRSPGSTTRWVVHEACPFFT